MLVESPYEQFFELNGQPLDNGFVYIGIAGLDPQSNPQTVYANAALTITIAQPIRTTAGVPYKSGSPTRMYTANPYSIRVRNVSGAQIFYRASSDVAPVVVETPPAVTIGLFSTFLANPPLIDSTTKMVRSSGYWTYGKGDGWYVYDAAVDSTYVSTYPRAAFMGLDQNGNPVGFRLSPDQQFNVTMFGAKADDTTDDLPAFVAADNYLRRISPGYPIAGGLAVTRSLHIPQGFYYLSSTWNRFNTTTTYGDGHGNVAASTVLRFGNNCDGIVFNEYRTNGTAGNASTPTGLGDSGGSILRGMTVWGGNFTTIYGPYTAGDSPTGSGVVIRANRIFCENVVVQAFGEDGFKIDATSGSTGATAGNANQFSLINCGAIYNGRAGLNINGSDANGGSTFGFNAISCGVAGVIDYSFLGNVHVGAHVRDCCVADPTGCNNPTSTCKYGGLYYYVKAGQHVAASTTTPGTNSAVWATWGGSASSKTWVSGMTWGEGSPYATNPANIGNCRGIFVGCYAEGTQPPNQAFVRWRFTGCFIDEVGNDGTALWERVEANTFHVGNLQADIALYVGTTKVVGPVKTGWAAPAGTISRASLNTGTATLAQVAQALGALITDLHSSTSGHGLISP